MSTHAPDRRSLDDEQQATEEAQDGQAILSDAAVANLLAYFESIRAIVRRLLSEGYTLKDSTLIPPPATDSQQEEHLNQSDLIL